MGLAGNIPCYLQGTYVRNSLYTYMHHVLSALTLQAN